MFNGPFGIFLYAEENTKTLIKCSPIKYSPLIMCLLKSKEETRAFILVPKGYGWPINSYNQTPLREISGEEHNELSIIDTLQHDGYIIRRRC